MAKTPPIIKIVHIYDSADATFTVPEVAKRLNTSPAFVRKLIQLKLLPAIGFGRYARVRKFRLNEFLERFEGKDVLAAANAAERERKTAHENK